MGFLVCMCVCVRARVCVAILLAVCAFALFPVVLVLCLGSPSPSPGIMHVWHCVLNVYLKAAFCVLWGGLMRCVLLPRSL